MNSRDAPPARPSSQAVFRNEGPFRNIPKTTQSSFTSAFLKKELFWVKTHNALKLQLFFMSFGSKREQSKRLVLVGMGQARLS